MEQMNPVSWFEIYVDDMPRAKAFYEAVFKINLVDMATPNDDPSITMVAFPSKMEGPGCSGALVKMEGMIAGGNSTIVYINSNDCAVETKRIEGAGGKILQPKTSLGEYGFMSLFLDSEGNTVGIYSMA